MDVMKIVKMVPGFLYLLGSALLASWSLDLIWEGLKLLMIGQGGAVSFFGGIGGLLLGFYLMLRYVYQFDRKQGRVKRKVKMLE